MDKRKFQIECLVQAQSFETLWAYFSQSGGHLYDEECRQTAVQFAESYEELLKLDSRFSDPKHLKMDQLGFHNDVAGIAKRIKEWGKGEEINIYQDARMSRFATFAFISGLKIVLLTELKVNRFPTLTLTVGEQEHSARFVRWKAHMPKVVLEKNPDEVFQGASKTPTIAVVGDIRRSQDLMTYAQKPRDFSKRMVRFITKTRKLIDKHAGFFDKFTGDGFIVYFNHAICKAAGLNYIECFTNFLSDEFDLATPLFQEWSLSIRKLPTTEIGLAIGADIGQIKFEDIDNHLIAVGDAIVWAARMASVATSNETIVNNLLFAALKDRQDISFQERSGQTKTGETFLAKALNFADASQPSDA